MISTWARREVWTAESIDNHEPGERILLQYQHQQLSVWFRDGLCSKWCLTLEKRVRREVWAFTCFGSLPGRCERKSQEKGQVVHLENLRNKEVKIILNICRFALSDLRTLVPAIWVLEADVTTLELQLCFAKEAKEREGKTHCHRG